MVKKYRALRFTASLLKVIGIIIGGLTILLSLGNCGIATMGGAIVNSLINEFGNYGGYYNQPGDSTVTAIGFIFGLLGAIFTLLVGGGLATWFYATGEAIYVQMDVEENTRYIGTLLYQKALSSEHSVNIEVQRPDLESQPASMN